MRVPVHSILFRKLQKSNAEAFLGGNRGEYDLRYGKLPAITTFTEDFDEESPTTLGGWTKHLPIQPFDGPDPVPAKNLRLRYMGSDSARADDTYIASQSSDPYPLWKPDRARPGAAVAADLVGDVALVVRDVQGHLHARWVRREDVPGLPEGLRQAINRHEKGVYTVPESGAGPSPQVAELIAALRRHHNVLLYGPPGTGKTHLVAEVRRHFGHVALQIDTEAETAALSESGGGDVHHAWATFHQSYSYEDFLIGLRPRPIDGGGFDLVPHPGILLELAEWARKPDKSSLLVIDEINRGNVSRIFGEFITLMEPDKRLADDGTESDQTVKVRLPYVDAGQEVEVGLPDGTAAAIPVPFTMPRRVYTLATMNSVDKSVAPLDAALRRRFHVVNVAPRTDAFRARLHLDGRPLTRELVPATPSTLDDARWLGLALLEHLNQRITYFLSSDFQLGEWFLKSLVDADSDDAGLAALADVWRTAVMPQLEDYFVGRADQLSKTLADPPETEEALVVDEPDTAFVELGAVRSVRANPVADDTTLLRFMAKIVRPGLPVAPAAREPDTSGPEAPSDGGAGDAHEGRSDAEPAS